jgi:hypothetical protein
VGRDAVIAVLGALMALASPSAAISFPDLVERAKELDGTVIVIEGWIASCGESACALRMKESGPGNPYLGISAQSPAYADLLAAAPGKVRVTARFNGHCVINICMGDGGYPLMAEKVEPLSRSDN